jgi:large subunit ribosomal protein L5e
MVKNPVSSHQSSSTMSFNKIVKTSAYHSRFQTPFRRRREGKTDYYARKRLVTQHKAKYNTPKYRLVVRFTNKDIIAQIVSSQLKGDIVFTAAYAHELPRYGVKHGLTNWAAAYAVGLLVARRALKKLGLDETYKGVEEVEGEFELTEAVEDGPRPFKVFLDVGMTRTTTGAKCFGVLKGASDGGLYVPHSASRFPGWDIESEELDSETLRKYIFAGHVSEYMEELADDDEERFRQIFQSYLDDEVDADSVEEILQAAHEQIRADPDHKPTAKKTKAEYAAESKKYKQKKLTKAERDARVQAKIQEIRAQQ